MALILANVLAVVSGLLSALFLFGVLRPRRFIAAARGFMIVFGIGGAVAARLLLAALLWFSAPVSSTPAAFRILALLMFAAAAAGLVLGTDRVVKLVDRMAGWPPVAVRLPSAAGLAFSAFVLWSASSAVVGT